MKILSTLATGALATLATAAIAAPATAQLGQRTVLAGAESAQAPRGDLFIQGLDSVWTATGEVLTNVSIRIEDGEIREIGPDIGSPDDGATVIDGRGLTAMPGIVDEHSHSGMDRGTNEGSTPISAEVRVADALRTDALNMYQALSGGVTTSLILHGSANPIGGESQVIKMRYGLDSSTQLLFEGAPRIVKFALGENVTQKNFSFPGETRFPASRQGVEALYVQAFTAAREYRDAWERYRDDPDSFRVPPRRDLRLETLVDIMEGDVRVHAHSYRSDEIVMLMRIAERFGFRIDAFTHVLEGYKVADELAEHGAGASTFSDWWMYKLEAYDAIPYNAAIMHGHGVLTSLNSDIPWLQSFMVYEMNKPVKYGGISREDALRMLTLYPAMQLRVDDRVGSIEVGKDGDIVLLNGDPFDAYTRVEKTIVDGIVYYDL
ncbi:MAG: amidohydrolase family protein, partial [Gemmatimonadota bacterium]